MRWIAAAATVLLVSVWAAARAQTTNTFPLARDGGSPPALEDGGTAVRPFAAGPDGGAPASSSPSSSAPLQVERRNGVDYVGTGTIKTAPPESGADDGSQRNAQQSPAEAEDLRRRIAALERRVAMANDQSQQLTRLNEQISELRQEIAQIEAQRDTAQQAVQQQAVESKTQTQQAVTTLQAAQQALASGNGDVGGTLSSVAASLPPSAQRELQAAQESLRASDLYGARAHIAAAIAASQR
jgi:TolA-binding protein